MVEHGQAAVSTGPLRGGPRRVRSRAVDGSRRRRCLQQPGRRAAGAGSAGTVRGRGRRGASPAAGFPGSGAQSRDGALEARSNRGIARRLPPRQPRPTELRGRALRRGAGAARPEPSRRGSRGVRAGRAARQPRGCQRQGMSRSLDGRFRARMGRLRGAMDRGKVARRSVGNAVSHVVRPRTEAVGACSCSTITASATRSSSLDICR